MMKTIGWRTIGIASLVLIGSMSTVFMKYSSLINGSSASRHVFIRLTLDVDTPEGSKTGTSVIEETVIFDDGPTKNSLSVIRFNIRGQATVVDLDARGLLFCVLARDWTRKGSSLGPGHVVDQIFHTHGDPHDFDMLNTKRPQAQVPFYQVPLLVRFRDVDDPRTVEVVAPDDLEKSFGPGVRLKAATISITDGPITTVDKSKMPSYQQRYDWREWRRALDSSDPRKQVGPDVFRINNLPL